MSRVVYERVGADPEELIPEMKRLGLMVPGRGARLREILDRRARFSPVLRFILANKETRTFVVERWCYLGSPVLDPVLVRTGQGRPVQGIDDWISVGSMGSVGQLARQWIPKLGTDALFEVY